MVDEALAWATTDPSQRSFGPVRNLVGGAWQETQVTQTLPDPLTGEPLYVVPETQLSELAAVIAEMQAVPAYGLHNPFRNVSRYSLYGQVCARAAECLRDAHVLDFFTRLIMRTVPKSRPQAEGEVKLLRGFLLNFAGDQVRYLARGFSVPGDHLGQESCGYRWPYGAVAIIAPFNFPLEIPALQLLGALFMGNKVLLKPDPKGAICIEQFVRMLIHCGMPATDLVLLNGGALAMEHLVKMDLFRLIQFTGSTHVAHHLSALSKGKVRFEDSGYNWKLLSPLVRDLDYVAYVCDQDAYAFGGQKCSAQKLLLAHRNWTQAGLVDKLASLAQRRSLRDLTLVPILTWSTERLQTHVAKLLSIEGARLLFGGKPLEGHQIPAIYGAFEPTAIFIPLPQFLAHIDVCSIEVFGPLQLISEWTDLTDVLPVLSRIGRYLTAGVVSNDPEFVTEVLGASVNGTTYAGARARTSGAPQNHWFGAAGDPRGSGIGTRESIIQTWSCHREVIWDVGPVPADWTLPPPS